jgi:ankyrin repeat protein
MPHRTNSELKGKIVKSTTLLLTAWIATPILLMLLIATGCTSTETTATISSASQTPATSKTPVQGGSKTDALVTAAGNGDLTDVKKLLQEGGKIDAVGKQGVNALMMACLKKQTEVVKFLLDSGASAGAVAPVGEGEDTQATTFGYVAVCKDERTTHGATPLFLAALSGASDIVQMLLEKGVIVDATTANGATPLYIACQMGNKDVVKLLLAAKAKTDITTKYEWTPLFAACWKGDTDSVQLLLDAGADVNATGTMFMIRKNISGPIDVEMRGGMSRIENISALYIATMAGKADIVNLLLAKGANTSMKTSAGETASDAARFVGNDAIVQLLQQANKAK